MSQPIGRIRAEFVASLCCWFQVSLCVLCGGCRHETGARVPAPSASSTSGSSLAPAVRAPAAPQAAPSSSAGAATTPFEPPTAALPNVSDTDPALVFEDRDRDPRSDTVTIKLIVDPRRKAHVFWGRKDLGEAPLELQRPRDSGPVDLLVTAPGFLPLHTRAFTDRDDQLFLRLFSPGEGPQILGYAARDGAAAHAARDRSGRR